MYCRYIKFVNNDSYLEIQEELTLNIYISNTLKDSLCSIIRLGLTQINTSCIFRQRGTTVKETGISGNVI